MNYAQLVEAIKGYTENDFPDTVGSGGLTSTEQIDIFIVNAEERIFNSVQLLDLRKNVTGSVTANNKYLSVPSDWLATFSIALINANTGSYEFLLNKDVSFIRSAFPTPNVTGPPTHYAFFDVNSFILGPTPDQNYGAELHYFYYPQSITVAGSSWLGDNFESVLLYGSLLEAYTFMKGEADVIAEYQKRYNEAMAMLKQLGEGKNRQDMYRTPQARYPVV
jgi:hypothetical protein